MKQSFGALGLLAIVALVLVGCSDDGNGDPVVLDSQFFEDTIETSAVPLIESVSTLFGVGTTAGNQLRDKAAEGATCEEQPCSGGGTLTACIGEFSETSINLDLSFDGCSEGDQTFNGSIVMNASETLTTLTYNLNVADTSMVGTMTLSAEELCGRAVTSGMSVSTPLLTATTVANLLYCTSEWPDGTMTQTIDVPGTGGYVLDLVVDSLGNVNADVSSLDGTPIAVCSGDLTTKTFTCQMLDGSDAPAF